MTIGRHDWPWKNSRALRNEFLSGCSATLVAVSALLVLVSLMRPGDLRNAMESQHGSRRIVAPPGPNAYESQHFNTLLPEPGMEIVIGCNDLPGVVNGHFQGRLGFECGDGSNQQIPDQNLTKNLNIPRCLMIIFSYLHGGSSQKFNHKHTFPDGN